MLFVALLGGLLDFFITYGVWVFVFLMANLVVVRNLDLRARFHRVHPYAFYLSLASVVFRIVTSLSR